MIGAFADAEAVARALATLPRRQPAVVARPMPRLAFATVVLASTMTVGTAFAQDLPAIAELAVARVVALIEGPVPLQAAAEAPVAGAPWRDTPAADPRVPEPVSLPVPASPEVEPEPELPAPALALEPAPPAEPVEADVEPPPAQPERAAEEPRPADRPIPVPTRAGPPQLPDGGTFEEPEPVVEPAPVAESAPALPEAAAVPELPSGPEPTAEPPVLVEVPDPAEDEEEPPVEEPVDEEPVEDEPDGEEPGEDEGLEDDEGKKKDKDKKDKPDHPEHPEHPDHPEHPEHPEHPDHPGEDRP